MSQSEPDWKSTSPQAIHERKVVLQRRSLFVYVPFSLVIEAIQMIAHLTDREEGDLEFLKGGIIRVGPCIHSPAQRNSKLYSYVVSNSGWYARLSDRRPVLLQPGIGEYRKFTVSSCRGADSDPNHRFVRMDDDQDCVA